MQELCPGRADKVTEMLLQLEESEVLRLIESGAALNDKVLEATRALEEANNQHSDSDSEDLQTWCSEELLNLMNEFNELKNC